MGEGEATQTHSVVFHSRPLKRVEAVEDLGPGGRGSGEVHGPQGVLVDLNGLGQGLLVTPVALP